MTRFNMMIRMLALGLCLGLFAPAPAHAVCSDSTLQMTDQQDAGNGLGDGCGDIGGGGGGGGDPDPVPTSGPWTTGAWSACSETCGGGTQTRSVTCAYDSCTGAQPEASQSCNTQDCPVTPDPDPTPSGGSCEQSCDQYMDERTVSCPSGQTGSIQQERAIHAGNVCGAQSSWQTVQNTCQATPPTVEGDGTTLFGEDAYNCAQAGNTDIVRRAGVCDSRGSTPYVTVMKGEDHHLYNFHAERDDSGRIRVLAGTMQNTGRANPDWNNHGLDTVDNYNAMSRACARKGYKYFQGYIISGNDWDGAVYRDYNMPSGNSGSSARTAGYTNLGSWLETGNHKGCTGCETASEVYCTNDPNYTGCSAMQFQVQGYDEAGQPVVLGADSLPAAPFGKRVMGTTDIVRQCGGGNSVINRHVYTCRPGGWKTSATVGDSCSTQGGGGPRETDGNTGDQLTLDPL